MTATALVLTLVLLIAGLFAALDAGVFLAPYRSWLLREYGRIFLVWVGVLGLNLFGLLYLALRVIGLKDTGRKLAHIDQELRRGSPIAQELADRLEDL